MIVTMDKVIQFNNRTIGRDKLARLAQYASRVIWHVMQQRNANSASVNKFKSLEYILSNFRKLLRLGRCVDTLYSASLLLHHDDLLIKLNCTFSKIAYGVYLLCDHFIWFGRTGFANINIEKWNRVANRYWLLTLIMNLIRDFVEIKRLLNDQKIMVKRSSNPKAVAKCVIAFAQAHKDVTVDTVKNSCDIFIPLTGLGYLNLSPSVIGLLGVISSSAAIYSYLDPFAKLPLT